MKNTIIALVLSFLVLFGYMFVQTMIYSKKSNNEVENQVTEQSSENNLVENEVSSDSGEIPVKNEEFYIADEDENLTEQTYTIENDLVKVVFTNRGGDIVNYQLKNHLDKETGLGVEMVDNVTDTNRAFSLSLGSNENPTLNELFYVKFFDDDPNSIAFFRNYEIKDKDGNLQKYALGKKYTFKDGEYVFKLDVTVNALGDSKGIVLGDSAYTLRTSPQIGPHYDKKNRYELRQYLALNGSKKIRKAVSNKTFSNYYDWAGVAGKYFAMLVKPVSPLNMKDSVVCSTSPVNEYDNAQIYLTRKAAEEKNINDSYYIYVGPRNEKDLIRYNSQEKNAWGLSGIKFNQALQTSGLLVWLEVALKWVLEMIYKPVKNWGVAIIILTVILKIILFPLNKKTAVGSLKMQDLQPKMQALQAKYQNDQQKLSVEMQKLYKEAGYNPMSGCLPMIIQMLILFALYNVFNNYFEFRGASFIKGWIDDLSVGDSIWSWNKNIFLISGFTQNNLRILPFVYTGSQLLNGKITQYGGSAGANAGQMKFMMYGMPILFFFVFYNVPSGLLLYWSVSNILQIGQQIVINKIMKKKRAEQEKNKPEVNKNVLKFKGGKKKTR